MKITPASNKNNIPFMQKAGDIKQAEDKLLNKDLLKGAAISGGAGMIFPFIGLLDGDSFKEVSLPKKGIKTLGAYAGAGVLGYALYKTADHFTKCEDKRKEGRFKTGLKSLFMMLAVPAYIKIDCWDKGKNFSDYMTGSKKKLSIACLVLAGALPLVIALQKMFGAQNSGKN